MFYRSQGMFGNEDRQKYTNQRIRYALSKAHKSSYVYCHVYLIVVFLTFHFSFNDRLKRVAATEVNTENAVNEQKPEEVPLIESYRKDDKKANNVC